MFMKKGDVLFINMHKKQELSLFAEESCRNMPSAKLNQLFIETGGMKHHSLYYYFHIKCT